MTLIKSISGIRGTIGGKPDTNLTPADIVKYTAAYATFLRRKNAPKSGNRYRVVVGRDARVSGGMARSIICGTLMGMGCDVVDIGLVTTPTTEIAVNRRGADGGIIITASHNPRHWNALKLLGADGVFLNKEEGKEVLDIANANDVEYADVDSIGSYGEDHSAAEEHISAVLSMPLVDEAAIRAARLRVCADTINSVGSLIIPQLLERLGVECTLLNGTPDGNFAHNPEPLEKNLGGIMGEIRNDGGYDLGIVVDPDVDRLAFICEDGTMFGEEYTLVSVADYVLSHTPGNTVSNLSSSRALRDVTTAHGCRYAASAVGEVNVVTKMKETGAVIGGEGNGGVIYPPCHYGRDALVGIALFLSALANGKKKASEMRAALPQYFMAKKRIDLTSGEDIVAILTKVKELYKDVTITDIDGVKIDFPDKWVHLRASNTEPIIRVYSEAHTMHEADDIAEQLIDAVKNMH